MRHVIPRALAATAAALAAGVVAVPASAAPAGPLHTRGAVCDLGGMDYVTISKGVATLTGGSARIQYGALEPGQSTDWRHVTFHKDGKSVTYETVEGRMAAQTCT